MASILLYLLIGVVFMALVGSIIWLLYLVFGDRKEEKDTPIDLNFLSGIDTGVFMGKEVSVSPGKDGRTIVEIAPRDIDVSRISNVENVKVIVDKNKSILMPKGTLSKERNINILLPPSASDFPPALKNQLFGKALMWMTELRNLQNLEIDILEEGGVRKNELLKKIGTGEISREFMKFNEELVKDALESVVSAAEKKNKSGTSSSLIATTPKSSNE